MQTELVASIPLFVDHTEANLVSYDITPTGCINACFKDNRTVCAQVTEDTVRQFVRLAAQEKAPRFLRFLRMITMPNDQAIKHHSILRVTAAPHLSHHHLLPSTGDQAQPDDGAAGARREGGGASAVQRPAGAGGAQGAHRGTGDGLPLPPPPRLHHLHLTSSLPFPIQDHIHHPRGRLVYHMELVGLLSQGCTGKNAQGEMLVRELLPLSDLVQQCLLPELTPALRANYMLLLDDCLLYTSPSPRD